MGGRVSQYSIGCDTLHGNNWQMTEKLGLVERRGVTWSDGGAEREVLATYSIGIFET